MCSGHAGNASYFKPRHYLVEARKDPVWTWWSGDVTLSVPGAEPSPACILSLSYRKCFLRVFNEKLRQDRQCTYKGNIEERSRNHCCRGKAISITYSECVFVALIIQHAKGMRRIIVSSVACPAVPYFSTSHKRHHFRKKILNIKCVFWFKVPVILVRF
jgi:hypothetical protein